MSQTLPPEISFRVEVDITACPVKFTYFNQKGKRCNGDADVTEKNTCISYRLVNNTDQLIFASPIVDAKDPEDLIFVVSADQQTLSIYDLDLTNEKICFRLVVIKASEPTRSYISSDPIIRNIPS